MIQGEQTYGARMVLEYVLRIPIRVGGRDGAGVRMHYGSVTPLRGN